MSWVHTGWMKDGLPFKQDDVGDFVAFVYIIRDVENGREYIGKKMFWTRKTRSIKKKKKRYLAPSDWEKYHGSNKDLVARVAAGAVCERTILHLCESKGVANYLEAEEQFARGVLLDQKFYNDWIQVKVHRGHIRPLREREDRK